MLERVQERVAQGGVVERRDVPDPDRGRVEHDREHGVGEEADRALDAVDAARGRAQEDAGQAEDAEDRGEVEQHDVLRHVHEEELVAQAVHGRDQRHEDQGQAGQERDQAPGPGAARPVRAPHPQPAGDVDGAGDRHGQDRAGVEGPRVGDGEQSGVNCRNAGVSRCAPAGSMGAHAPRPRRARRRLRPAGLHRVRRAGGRGGRGAVRRLPASAAVAAGAALPALRPAAAVRALSGAAPGLRRGVGAGGPRRLGSHQRAGAEVRRQARPGRGDGGADGRRGAGAPAGCGGDRAGAGCARPGALARVRPGGAARTGARPPHRPAA